VLKMVLIIRQQARGKMQKAKKAKVDYFSPER
jgi:hypothetical protein